MTLEYMQSLAESAKANSDAPYVELRLYPPDLFAMDDWPSILSMMKSVFTRIIIDGFCPKGMMYANGFDPFAPPEEEAETD